MEIALHEISPSLPGQQVRPDGLHHLGQRVRTPAPHGVGLDVLVEHLVGIQLGAVGGQEDETDLVGVFLQPLRGLAGPVCRMPVDDEEHLLLR